MAHGVAPRRGETRGPVLADLDGAKLAITPLTADILHVRASPDGTWLPRRSWAVVPPDEAFDPPPIDHEESPDGVRIRTSTLVAEAGHAGLTISSRGGRILCRDGRGGGPAFEPDAPRSTWTQEMPPDRRYFGFGERTGLLEKRGRRYTSWTTDEWRHQGAMTDSLYVAVPFYLALDPDGQAFGVFLNHTHRSAFDLTGLADGVISMEAEAAELDWFLIFGPNPVDVVRRFTGLVGRASLPPRWALGYHQARWSYASSDEVRAVVRGLREHRIPTDVIHLDIDHMDDYRPFSWDPERFPDPGGLMRDLRETGMRAMTVVDAAVPRNPTEPIYAEGHAKGYFVRTSRDPGAAELSGYVWPGLCVFPDHARPEVRTWWGDLYSRAVDVGVSGFVNDMNEPAMHDRPVDVAGSGNTEPPPDTPFGPPTDAVTHAEIRNIYASLENQATADGLDRAAPETRPFVMSRAGFAGVQRHAAVWTGDNWSAWEHLEMSLPQLLNLGLSGIPIAGADIGGFFGESTPELLVRWAQLGALYPFCRNHSAKGTTRQEPWVWGEPTTTRYRRAIELRYRLLPYLYTLVREATDTGLPPLRPLFLHYPGDELAATVADEALVGRDLLIAPVVRPGKTHREVYLPSGRWYDVRSGEAFDGPAHILASAALDEDMPMYARGGAIVPMAPVMQWTDQHPVDPLTLLVNLDHEGRATGTIYEDDGATNAYRNGVFAITEVEARPAAGGTSVAGHRQGRFDPAARGIEIEIRGGGGVARQAVGDAPEWSVVVEGDVDVDGEHRA